MLRGLLKSNLSVKEISHILFLFLLAKPPHQTVVLGTLINIRLAITNVSDLPKIFHGHLLYTRGKHSVAEPTLR